MTSAESEPLLSEEEREPDAPASPGLSRAETFESLVFSRVDEAALSTSSWVEKYPVLREISRSVTRTLAPSQEFMEEHKEEAERGEQGALYISSAIAANLLLWRRDVLRILIGIAFINIILNILLASESDDQREKNAEDENITYANGTIFDFFGTYEACNTTTTRKLADALEVHPPDFPANTSRIVEDIFPTAMVGCLADSMVFFRMCPGAYVNLTSDVTAASLDAFAKGCVDETFYYDNGYYQRSLLYSKFLNLEGLLLMLVSITFLSLLSVSLYNWRRYARSRAYIIMGSLTATCGPLLVAVLPWYTLLGFSSVEPYNSGDCFDYRLKISTQVGVLGSAVVYALLPALVNACALWKSIAPESSIWGFALGLAAMLHFFLGLPTYIILLQLIGTWWFAIFVVLQSIVYLPYLLTVPYINSQLQSDPTLALASLRKAHSVVGLMTLSSYLIVIIPLFIRLGDKGKLDDFLSMILSAFTPASIMLLLFNSMRTYFVALLACIDVLCLVIESLRDKDGAYIRLIVDGKPQGDKTFAGIEGIVRMLKESREDKGNEWLPGDLGDDEEEDKEKDGKEDDRRGEGPEEKEFYKDL